MNKTMLKEIFDEIKTRNKIVIHTHERPDGDCTGSAYGLKDIIKTTWPEKEVYVAAETSDFVSFNGTPDVITDETHNGALSIVLDTANRDRVADKRFVDADMVIKIDHHIKVDEFGDIDYVDTSRPAATLIILDLFLMFEDELKMTKDGARALFFGTLTDTGRFKYSGVDGDTFRNVAKLYDYGLVASEVYAYLDTRTEELTRFKGYFLQNYSKTKNGVAYFKVENEVLDKFGVSLEEATSLVNELGYFKDCPVWILMAEYEESIVRARIRSKGPAINLLANEFNGGGHAMASGANLGTWDVAEKLLIEADALVKEYKENQKQD